MGTVASAGATAQSADVRTSISELGDFDYARRMNAARVVRRAPAAEAVPALIEAVTKHPDEFVRARTFVLLTGFNDSRTAGIARNALADRNDRLREKAYGWLELHPDPALIPVLTAALETETAEFVRPALIRALSALDADTNVRARLIREVGRGLDIFRGAVIDALAARRAVYALDAIAAVAILDGPLQDDAVLALGRIGDSRAVATLAKIQTKSPVLGLTIRVATCVIRGDCTAERNELVRVVSAGGDGTRPAAEALSMMAELDDQAAFAALVTSGDAAAAREDVAIAATTVALRRPTQILAWLEANPAAHERAVALLRDGFDMLEEDLAEEMFFATARATYWRSSESSGMRNLTATLIDKLEF